MKTPPEQDRITDVRPEPRWIVGVLAGMLALGKETKLDRMGIMRLNLVGNKFGRWTVLSQAPRRTASKREASMYWNCLCDCGNLKEVRASSLIRGKSKSCGCFREEYRLAMRTHGQSDASPEYKVWQNMLNRCRNPNIPGFQHYGGRGITVCERWQNSFENFFADMGPRPTARHSIDRINVDQYYSPDNCRWADAKTQVSNRRKIGALTQFSTQELTAELFRRLSTASLVA